MKKLACKTSLLVPVLAVALTGCGDKAGGNAQATAGTPPAAVPAAAQPAAMPGTWQGTVAETMDSGGYTYVLLDTGAQQIWCATTQTPVAVGDKVTVPQGQMMVDFRSATLDRVFPEIYFTNAVWQQGSEPQGGGMPAGQPSDPHGGTDMGMGGAQAGGPAGGGKLALDDQHVSGIQKAAGGYQVGEIHARSAELGGKAVKVRARVVKFTPNIMGTNWVHIQDGSGEGATVDLTVTTAEIVAVGDVIVVEGVLAVDKDFGAGYVYAAIIEKATVTKE
ncbi:MAG: DNA-binding protein [bacterium]|nr:DNA-binding protein [bacterium]